MLSKLKSLAGKVLEARNYSKNWVMPGLRRALGLHSTLKVWVNTPSGASVWLDKDPIDDLILKDLYEIPSVFFPEKMKFTAGDMILDLGSHHGIYIIEMLVRNPELYAVCVEPDPWGCHLMHKMAEKNKVADRIEIHNVAVGSEEGEAYLVESEDGSWGNYVSESEVGKGKRIKQAPLSSITRNRYFKLLKCNTEGGEYVIIPQALDLKLNPEFIILMTHGDKKVQAELLSKIESAGYTKKLVNDLPDNPSWHFTRINK